MRSTVATFAQLLFLATAKAGAVIAPAFGEMADRFAQVFVDKIVGSPSDWRSVWIDRVIFALVELETWEVLRGNAAALFSCRDSLTFRFTHGSNHDK